MVKIVAAAEWQWREALILIRLLFHLILIVFQSYGLKRKHVANEGQHGEGHEGGDLRPRKVHKVTFKLTGEA